MRVLAALLLLVVAAGCGGDDERAATTTVAKPPQRGPFDYDPRAPLLPQERVVDAIEGVQVVDVALATPSGRMPGYVITPRGADRRPAVVFLHGAGGNRDSMLPLAARWTADGGVSMTIEAAPIPQAATPQAALRAQRDGAAASVIRVRRALDYLETHPRVDPERIGVVGWSSGGRTAAIVAGVEPRVRALVLMSAGATPLSEYVGVAPDELKDDVERVLAEVDPLRWISRARPRTIFFQNGTRDEIVPRTALDNLLEAATKPQRVRWYDAGHELNARARSEQRAWLADRLSP